MMKTFFMPTKIVHGRGTLSTLGSFLPENEKVLLVTDRVLVGIGTARKVLEVLDEQKIRCAVFDEVPANPHEDAVEKALVRARKEGCGAVVALGGGSPLDVGKMVAFLLTNPGGFSEYQWDNRPSEAPCAPLVHIPTTAGTGSEVSCTAVIVSRGTKKGIRRDELFARAAIIDSELMVTMPPHITSTTGIDAFTHAYEAWVGRRSNPLTDALAVEAMRLLIRYLPVAYASGEDHIAREQVALAAAMGGIAMDQAGLGFIHSCSGPVASVYDVPHGLSNAVFLPHAMRFNMLADLDKHAQIAGWFGVDTVAMPKRDAAEEAIACVIRFLEDLQIPRGLYEYFREDADIPRFAEAACQMFLMKNNPRTPRPEDLIPVYEAVLKEKE